MTTSVERRCPVTWRYVLGLKSRYSQDGNYLLYEEDLSTLGEIEESARRIGRTHSVQLLRGFFLLETLLTRVSWLRQTYTGLVWDSLINIMRGNVPLRSREGLSAVLEAISEQQDSMEIDLAESRLSGQTQIYEGFHIAKSVGSTLAVGAVTKYLESLEAVAKELRSNLIDSEQTLGTIAIETHRAQDATNIILPQRLRYAQALTQITEDNPLSCPI